MAWQYLSICANSIWLPSIQQWESVVVRTESDGTVWVLMDTMLEKMHLRDKRHSPMMVFLQKAGDADWELVSVCSSEYTDIRASETGLLTVYADAYIFKKKI